MKRTFVGVVAVVGAACLTLPGVVEAQDAVFTGRVTAEGTGAGITGATVALPDLGVGVLTTANGVYTLTVPAARVRGQTTTLQARFIGYTPLRRPVTVSAGRFTQDFTLRQDVNRLSEVVVTGVSAATEAVKVPFAVSRVDTTQMPVIGSSPIAQLQGKIPGANIVSASGRPGSAPSVLMRGPVSINASGRSQQPLYIVDGVLLQGAIPDINPNDIANVEVLKGAAAANLYGARAGAGVINITTKTGRTAGEGIKFGFRSEAGLGDIPREFSIARRHFIAMDPSAQLFCSTATSGGSPCAQYINLDAEVRRVNEVSDPSALPPQNFRYDAGIARAPAYSQLTGLFQVNEWNRTYNVIGDIVTPSAFANTNLDMRGRVGATGIYASVSNLTQQGAVRELGGYSRNGFRLNIDQSFGDKLSAALTSFYSVNRSNGDNQDAGASAGGFQGTSPLGAGGNGFFRITRTPAFVNLQQRDQFGRYYIRSNVLNQGAQNANPLYDFANFAQDTKGNRFLGGISLKYTPLTWLDLESNFSYDRRNSDYTLLRDRGFRTTSPAPATSNGEIYVGAVEEQSLNSSVSATARRTFGDLLATFSTKYQYEQQDLNDQDQYGSNIVVPGLETTDAAADVDTKDLGSSVQQIRGINFFGTMQLDYKDRYIVQANLRRDGSSLFGAGNRWATFPGLSGTWIASRESWWPVANAISLAKIRAAYGRTGQRPSFAAQYATFTIGLGGALNPNTLGNPELEPEIRSETEVGVDFEFFNRVGLNATYAVNTIDKQILPVPLSRTSGFQFQWLNAGELQNKTVEFSLDVPFVNRPNLTYSGRVIFDRTRSEITRLDVAPFTGGTTLQATEAIFKFQPGERLGTLYGRDFVRDCAQLPAPFRNDCGSATSSFRRNDQGYVVWVGQGNQLTEGITRNLWSTQLPAATAPFGAVANWGMPILLRDTLGAPAVVSLGNVLPNYRLGFSQNFRYKRFGAYGLIDAAVGGRIWNQGYHWSLGDFMTGDQDQAGKSVEEAKPIGYYWRAGRGLGGSVGTGGFYDILGPNRETVEDATYAKIREMTVNYRVGQVGGVGDWTVGLVGRNLYTFSDYRGFDPEVGIPGGQLNNAALNGVDRFGFPNLRTFTVQLSSSF